MDLSEGDTGIPLFFAGLLLHVAEESVALPIIIESISIIILVIIAALIAGSESAFFSLTSNDLLDLQQSQSQTAKQVLRLHNQPKNLLATILILSTVVNVSIALLMARLLELIIPGPENAATREILDVAVVTFTLVLASEVVPKVYGTRNNVSFAQFMAYPFITLTQIMRPLAFALTSSTGFLERLLSKRAGTFTSAEELKHAIEITSGENTTMEERKILRGVISMGSTAVRQIMRSRTDMVAYDADTPLGELKRAINRDRYSRVPIYQGTPDHILGVLYIKDLIHLLGADENTTEWVEVVKPAYYIPDSKLIDALLQEFKKKKVHMAIVVDEYGGTAGIVTLEDVLEEIVGEIRDEFDDEDELQYSPIDDDTIIFDGKTALIDVARLFNLEEIIFDKDRGEAETIGGLMVEVLGNLPVAGQVCEMEYYTLTAEAVDRTRVRRIKMRITNREGLDELSDI